jgi:hypothetical protein
MLSSGAMKGCSWETKSLLSMLEEIAKTDQVAIQHLLSWKHALNVAALVILRGYVQVGKSNHYTFTLGPCGHCYESTV